MTGPDRSVLAGHSRGEGNVVVETEQERRAPEAGSVQPVSHGQRALWFLHQLAPESAAYNIAFALRLRSRSDARAIRAAFQAILDRHDILRSTFHERDGGPIRVVARSEERRVGAEGRSRVAAGRRV